MSDRNFLVFGDSIGKGVVLQPNSTRYKTVKFNLENDNKVNIKNYSMFGCTVSKGLSIVKKHTCELSEYDNVFLEYGGNDCDFMWSEIAEDPEKEHLPKTPLSEFKRLYQQIIDEIRSNGAHPIILTLPPLDPNRYFSWISKGINDSNILKWLGDVDMIYRWQEMYNNEVMLLAAKMAVPIIDIRNSFLKRNHYRNFLCGDGIHPNNDGYKLIYNTITEQYKPIVKK